MCDLEVSSKIWSVVHCSPVKSSPLCQPPDDVINPMMMTHAWLNTENIAMRGQANQKNVGGIEDRGAFQL